MNRIYLQYGLIFVLCFQSTDANAPEIFHSLVQKFKSAPREKQLLYVGAACAAVGAVAIGTFVALDYLKRHNYSLRLNRVRLVLDGPTPIGLSQRSTPQTSPTTHGVYRMNSSAPQSVSRNRYQLPIEEILSGRATGAELEELYASRKHEFTTVQAEQFIVRSMERHDSEAVKRHLKGLERLLDPNSLLQRGLQMRSDVNRKDDAFDLLLYFFAQRNPIYTADTQRMVLRHMLASAAEKNDIRRILFLEKHGADITQQMVDSKNHPYKETYLLHIVCQTTKPNRELARLLIARNPHVLNVPNHLGCTPLYYACVGGHYDLAELLLEYGADPNLGIGKPLLAACQSDHSKLAALLLQRGAEIDPSDGAALLEACRHNNLELIKILANRGARIHFGTDREFLLACENNNTGFVYYRLKFTEISYETLAAAFASACKAGRYEVADLLFKFHKNLINIHDEEGKTILFHAITHQNLELSMYLLERGIDTNRCAHDKMSPLIFACYRNAESIIPRLLQHNADPNMPDNDGNTPLHYACFTGNIPLVALLISNPQTNLSPRNTSNDSPLSLARVREPNRSHPFSRTHQTISDLNTIARKERITELLCRAIIERSRQILANDSTIRKRLAAVTECPICMDKPGSKTTGCCLTSVYCEECIEDIASRNNAKCPYCREEIARGFIMDMPSEQ